jgi:hypothetical protein
LKYQLVIELAFRVDFFFLQFVRDLMVHASSAHASLRGRLQAYGGTSPTSTPRFVGLNSAGHSSSMQMRTGELRHDIGKVWPANVTEYDIEPPLEVYVTPRQKGQTPSFQVAEGIKHHVNARRSIHISHQTERPLPVGAYVRLKYTKMNDCLGSGRVRYVGEVLGRPGVWYGLELDKPNGLHNGNPNSPLGIGWLKKQCFDLPTETLSFGVSKANKRWIC